MNGDGGSAQAASTSTSEADAEARDLEPAPQAQVIPLQPRPRTLRIVDASEDAATLVYERKPRSETEPLPAEPEREIPLFEGTLVIPAPVARERTSTLVMPPPPLALEHTLVMPPPIAPEPVHTLVLPAPAVSDHDPGPSTRIAPIEDWLREPRGSSGLPETSVKTPTTGLSPRQALRARWVSRWRALSPINRASVMLSPFALLSTVAFLWLEMQPVENPTADSSAVTDTRAAPVAPAKPTARAPAPAASAMSAPAKTQNGKTLQRAAADAVAEGNTAAALKLYRELAAAEPNVAAYRAAVRILEERAKTE